MLLFECKHSNVSGGTVMSLSYKESEKLKEAIEDGLRAWKGEMPDLSEKAEMIYEELVIGRTWISSSVIERDNEGRVCSAGVKFKVKSGDKFTILANFKED